MNILNRTFWQHWPQTGPDPPRRNASGGSSALASAIQGNRLDGHTPRVISPARSPSHLTRQSGAAERPACPSESPVKRPLRAWIANDDCESKNGPGGGTEAANLFGGGLLHRGGLGSGEQTTIYAFRLYFPVRPRNAVKRSNLPLRKWPRSASQHRSHRSPPNRDLRIRAVGSRAMLSLLRRLLKDAKEIV